jgi:Ca-activated chloride channel homolog
MIARIAALLGALLLAGSGLDSSPTHLSFKSVIGELSPDPIQVPEPRQPTFSARVDVVRVDVLVTDNGRPVTGLQASDFELLDNAVPQTIDLVDVERLPLDLVLAFDISASVAGTRLGQLRSASDVLLDELRENDRAALVTFNHLVRVRSDLTRVRDGIRDALEQVRAEGATALHDGTYLALMTAGDGAARRLQIVFSDGFDTASWLSADDAIQAARRSGFAVYAVSVAEAGKSPAFLRDLCDATGGRLMEVESTWNLSSVFLDVLDEFRQRYVISYSPREVAKDGWHRLEVRARNRKATVKARPGYFAGS